MTSVNVTVRTIREARGFSQGELARRAGLAKATVNDLESNAERSPGLDTLGKIADALDVHIATLIGVETDATVATAVKELPEAEASQALAGHGMQLTPSTDAPIRFYLVERGYTLGHIRFHPGDVLTVKATAAPEKSGAVIVQNRGQAPRFEAKLFLDPYLIGPDSSGKMHPEMRQNPDLTIIGEIHARTGALA